MGIIDMNLKYYLSISFYLTHNGPSAWAMAVEFDPDIGASHDRFHKNLYRITC